MILGKLTVKAVDTKGTPIKGATWSIVGQDIYTDMRAGRQADVKPGKWKILSQCRGLSQSGTHCGRHQRKGRSGRLRTHALKSAAGRKQD